MFTMKMFIYMVWFSLNTILIFAGLFNCNLQNNVTNNVCVLTRHYLDSNPSAHISEVQMNLYCNFSQLYMPINCLKVHCV